MRLGSSNPPSVPGGVRSLLKVRARGVTSIEYLLVAALLVIVFTSVRVTLMELLLSIYKFLIEMICSPVL